MFTGVAVNDDRFFGEELDIDAFAAMQVSQVLLHYAHMHRARKAGICRAEKTEANICSIGCKSQRRISKKS